MKSQNRWIDVNKNEHLYIDKIKWIDENYIRTDGEGKYYFLERIKPILFPLSAINTDIEINKVKICILSYINESILSSGNLMNPWYADIESYGNVSLEEYSSILDTFHRYHIDYRGLIDKGLAISVFDLPENPYK